MTVALISVLGFLAMLSLVLSTAKRLRPHKFRLKASVTKWVSVDLEMQAACSTLPRRALGSPGEPEECSTTVQQPPHHVAKCERPSPNL